METVPRAWVTWATDGRWAAAGGFLARPRDCTRGGAEAVAGFCCGAAAAAAEAANEAAAAEAANEEAAAEAENEEATLWKLLNEENQHGEHAANRPSVSKKCLEKNEKSQKIVSY